MMLIVIVIFQTCRVVAFCEIGDANPKIDRFRHYDKRQTTLQSSLYLFDEEMCSILKGLLFKMQLFYSQYIYFSTILYKKTVNCSMISIFAIVITNY